MLCSSGGEICTALNPAGPRKLSHSAAMSVHFHSKRWTKTSPAVMCPLGRYVGGRVGRGGGGGGGGPGGGFWIPLLLHARATHTSPAVSKDRDTAGLEPITYFSLVAGVLLEVRVGDQLVCWYGIQIQIAGRPRTAHDATLPCPQVTASREAAVTHKISAPVA